MTESGKQKFRLFSMFLLLVSVIFWGVGQGAPGWKTGMAILPLAVIATVNFYLEQSKIFRLLYTAFCLFFLTPTRTGLIFVSLLTTIDYQTLGMLYS